MQKVEETGNFIRTFSGIYIDVFNAGPEDIAIEDIAHHLAHMPRYSGAAKGFYSVAQHCIEVSEVLYTAHSATDYTFAIEVSFHGLLHDATEAYLQDLAGPIKHHPLMKGYRAVEHKLQESIDEAFNLDYKNGVIYKEVKRADSYALNLEWERMNATPYALPELPFKQVESHFLEIYYNLKKLRDEAISSASTEDHCNSQSCSIGTTQSPNLGRGSKPILGGVINFVI